MIKIIKYSPHRAMKQAKEEKEKLLSLFPDKSFVLEIPNGYCSDWCCKHLPWFTVTTKVGPITIGWRKRVISIDWKQTVRTKTSNELFAKEDVTKEYKLIHAWSYEDAKRYVNAIINSVE